ncbi:hypothetical protein PPYR_15776 [Photinus pyralis]|uniref:Succinate--hydroxymethylglutarate CoA-transferase n=2 Tax=Photinus pyralis TaxID=7054 RepID=A0A5N4AJD6_PHOPY|nr:succinate--hydroxymethylglutarate CoA-transferase [Photinus pyralis]KAB0797462.1 hypothetical protein PPYR_15776 [Photinus pyralis]
MNALRRSVVFYHSKFNPAYHNVIKSITTTSTGVADNVSPLEGVRVLDLTRIVAGPYCTMILGDLGAEVIKIERLGTGDECRRWGPPFINDSPETCYFVAVNRNKKSVCVDMKSKNGREIIYELAKKSDVLVENFVPGGLDKLRLGYEDIRGIAPHLIYCSISGYGNVGPYRNKPGYDVIAASMGGLLHITGPEDGAPVKVGIAMTDIATGLYAHGAIMASLIKRSRTGLGQKIDCNLLSTQLSTLINIGSNYLNAEMEGKRWGTAHESIVPYETFPTKNGYLTIGAGSDQQYVDFCKRIGQPNLATNPKFVTNKKRIENRKELLNLLYPVFLSKTNAEWMQIFEGSSSPCGPVNSLREAFDDPHVKAIGIVKELQHATAGHVKVVGPPVVYSTGGNYVRSPPPALGEHTREVLKGVLQFNDDYIDTLVSEKVIQ